MDFIFYLYEQSLDDPRRFNCLDHSGGAFDVLQVLDAAGKRYITLSEPMRTKNRQIGTHRIINAAGQHVTSIFTDCNNGVTGRGDFRDACVLIRKSANLLEVLIFPNQKHNALKLHSDLNNGKFDKEIAYNKSLINLFVEAGNTEGSLA